MTYQVKAGARCHVVRTAMVGGGLAYDVYLPSEDVDVPAGAERPGILHLRDYHGEQREFWRFADATVSAEIQAMPRGIARYRAWCEHERRARGVQLAMAQTVFPELRSVACWPEFWLSGLPVEREESAEHVISLAGRFAPDGADLSGLALC